MKINSELIKEKRKEKGFSIDEMAVKLGLTNGSMYWKRENGDYKFKAEETILLSQFFEIPIKQLFLSSNYSKTEINNTEQII